MDNKNLKILDCTFRDGGYYTNWNFSKEFLSSYLDTVNSGIVDIVEIGLRTINSSSYHGPFAYTPTDFFETCKNYKKLNFSTLVNWKDVKDNFNEFIRLFPGKDRDFISLVRIAAKNNNLTGIEKFVSYLKEKGYKVALNIQRCDFLINEQEDVFKEKLEVINPDILYFADTNGFLDPTKAFNLVKRFAEIIDIPIGVHMHNNQGLAYANTLQSIQAGATYLDSTFSGIGRGPGNTQTEYLSCFVKDLTKEQILNIIEIIDKFFNPLKKKYLWGENYFYFLSGLNNQSASLMHNLMNNKTYSKMSLVNISSLNEEDSISTLAKKYNSDFNFLVKKPTAAIIANGQNWKQEESQIKNYLTENNIYKLHINYPINQSLIPLIDAFCSCDPFKILDDFSSYILNQNIPLICPENILKDIYFKKGKIKKINYECIISKNQLQINDNNCIIPYMQSLFYGIVYLYSRGYKNILLVGVEGFKVTSKNLEIINCINHLNMKYNDLELTCVSLNRLGIRSKSIFEVRNIN